ncbi:MAG: zinc-dependent metalloprotease [Chitinophagaceae bacterium]|nr:zinc-dependent metalloprotease [Oligoflexus sp.]
MDFSLPMLKGVVMQRMLGLRLLTLLLVTLAFATGCEKKRVSHFVQGDGEFVYAIKDFQNVTYTLKTGKKRTPGVTTRADELSVNPGSSVMRSFNSVEFKLKTDVGEFSSASMNNFDFYGDENASYQVQVAFTEQKLVFFQIAQKEQIPTNELTYAENIGNNTYRVPLFGLPLDKVTVERVKDERGRETNQIHTFAKKFLSEATHFLVNVNTPSYFDSKLKLDMLPSKFFDENNQWFYEVTVVDKPIALDSSGLELGNQLSSGKVRFAKTNNSVLAVDLNIADEAVGQDAEKLNVIFEIPVQWMDYRLVKNGDNAYLKEEAFSSIEQGAKFWKDREYALLQLDRVLSIDAASTNNIKIKRLEVGDDYFSFIIYDSLTKISLHYSFAKKNEVAVAKVYPREDLRKFGFFTSMKELYSGELNGSEATQSKALIQNRMYPVNNKVTFHVTENTPMDPIFINAIQKAINGWDWAFSEAAKGTASENNPIHVVLDVSKPVKNGDARYHKVSFYGYQVESGLLGYGPSVSDNRTGEIFSSTNHIYLRNYRESILRNLTNYIRFRVGAYNGLDVDGITVPNQILAVQSNPGYDFNAGNAISAPGTVSANAGSVDMFSALPGMPASESVPHVDVSAFKNFDAANNAQSIVDEARLRADQVTNLRPNQASLLKEFMTARKKMESGQSNEQDFLAAMKNATEQNAKTTNSCEMLAATSLTFKEIEDVCGKSGTEFSDYINDLKSHVASGEKIYRLDSENEVMLKCAQKLMEPTLVATLAHEFGHNFGLRHNFQGSADAPNFARDANGVPESRTSSVMDYSHQDANRGYRPAPYDIAALRYGYYNAVEVIDRGTGDHTVLSIASNDPKDLRPLEKRIKDATGDKLVARPFAFCTDENIGGYPTAQVGTETPFCERWDQGSDPVSKVRSAIDTMVTSMVTNGNRFDMEGVASSAGLARSAINRSIGGIRNVYDKYRFMLYNGSKKKSSQAGQIQDDPYFDTTTEAATELLVMGADNLKKADAIVQELRANPTMPTLELEKKIGQFTGNDEIVQYKIASEITKDFMLELIFSEANYCIALHSNGSGFDFVDAEPLSTALNNNFFVTGIDTTRCEDMSQYFATKNKKAGTSDLSIDKVVSVGNTFNNVPFSANPEVLSLRQDTRTGFGGVRTIALAYLSPRSPLGGTLFKMFSGSSQVQSAIQAGLLVSARANFLPSLMDGEAFRTRYLAKLQDRLTGGVSVANLVSYANKKVKISDNRSVNLAANLKERKLPFYQEEKGFLNLAWMAYTLGVPSPRAVTSNKTASTLISSLPWVNFKGFGGDQGAYSYLVSSDQIAYFTQGAAAIKLIEAFNDTDNTLRAVTQKKSIVDSGSQMQLLVDGLDNKVTNVVSGYITATQKLADRYQSMNDVMYQVRICVLNTLVKQYDLKAANFSSLLEQNSDASRFSVAKYCEAPRGESEAAMAKLETQYTSQATSFLDYIKTDKKIINSTTVDSILTMVGLPKKPNEAADPQKTLEAIFKSQQALPLTLVGSDYAGRTLSSLEYNTALNAISKISDGLLAGATVPSIKSAVTTARTEEFEKLQQDEPYVTALNDKLEVLRNLIFSGI